MIARVIPGRVLAVVGIALLGLCACDRLGLGQGHGQDEMSWARAALRRNDRIEVVAADQQASTFTLRLKDTGELRVVRLDQIVGAPPWVLERSPRTPGQDAAAATAVASTNDPNTSGTDPGLRGSAPDPGATGSAGTVGTELIANSPGAADSANLAAPGEPASAAQRGFTAAETPLRSDVTADTPGGRLLKAGPGYAIKAGSNPRLVSSRVTRESPVTTAELERLHEPIVCRGSRLLQINNRNWEFDGDAVSAEEGCELHITNSHITAKGTGVSARGAASVHIENSQIEGEAASIDTADGAQIYATSSTFRGMRRRFDTSAFHDLGGNVWN
jgi:hypothetical protein